MFKVKPLGPRGKKISKWVMILGFALVLIGFGAILVWGLNNLSQLIFSLLFFTILLGVLMSVVGFSGYFGKILFPPF